MIPREEILKQVNRFYDTLESLNTEIEKTKKPNFTQGMKYFKLTAEIGVKMQYAISDLKDQLDILEPEDYG